MVTAVFVDVNLIFAVQHMASKRKIQQFFHFFSVSCGETKEHCEKSSVLLADSALVEKTRGMKFAKCTANYSSISSW